MRQIYKIDIAYKRISKRNSINLVTEIEINILDESLRSINCITIVQEVNLYKHVNNFSQYKKFFKDRAI